MNTMKRKVRVGDLSQRAVQRSIHRSEVPSEHSDLMTTPRGLTMNSKRCCLRRLESAYASLQDALHHARSLEVAEQLNIALSIDEALADVRVLVAKARTL